MTDALRHRVFVSEVSLSIARRFIERIHYSHSVLGVTVNACYMVLLDDEPVGSAIFGAPSGMGVKEKYTDDSERMTELRRFVLIDSAPRNTESCALGKLHRAMKAKGYSKILAYSDPAYGHDGTIYRAAGYKFHGKTAGRKHVLWERKQIDLFGGHKVKLPDRNIHQVDFPYHEEIRVALASGSAERVSVPGKYIYIKTLATT